MCPSLSEAILALPPTVMEELKRLHDQNSKLVMRVSADTFLVRAEVSQQHQFGLIHVRLSNTPSESSPNFYCPCSSFARFPSQTAHSGGGTTPRLSKRCIHLYICLWALASNVQLGTEYSITSLFPLEHKSTSTSATTGKSGCMYHKLAIATVVHFHAVKESDRGAPSQIGEQAQEEGKQESYHGVLVFKEECALVLFRIVDSKLAIVDQEFFVTGNK